MELIITETQILALIVIAALCLIGYRFKQPGISLVAGAGLLIIDMQIYQSSPDLLLFGLMFMLAVSQFVITLSHSSGRR